MQKNTIFYVAAVYQYNYSTKIKAVSSSKKIQFKCQLKKAFRAYRYFFTHIQQLLNINFDSIY